jgi:transposase InsO family protein
VGWLGITPNKFHDWRKRYGKVNEHNAWIPRDRWLEDWEKQAMIRFSFEYPLEGYRRLAFTILDGYSRYIVHGEIRPSMTQQDELVILQRAREKFPNERPRIISDNGSQFVAKDFKEFIRICGMTHVRTSPVTVHGSGALKTRGS